jgi:hypothetical protein
MAESTILEQKKQQKKKEKIVKQNKCTKTLKSGS